MTFPALIETLRCDGVLRDGSRCNKLLARNAIIVAAELACPKCGKRTVIASGP